MRWRNSAGNPECSRLRDYATTSTRINLATEDHQRQGKVQPDSRLWLTWWGTDDPRTAPLTVRLGDQQLDLEGAAKAAVDLAHAAHHAWLEGFQEAMFAEADAAEATLTPRAPRHRNSVVVAGDACRRVCVGGVAASVGELEVQGDRCYSASR